MLGRAVKDLRIARAVTALCVALMATVGSLYLFASGGQANLQPALAVSVSPVHIDTSQADAPSDYDGLDGDTVAAPAGQLAEREEPAPEPVMIRTTVDHTCPIDQYLTEAGLTPADAKRWTAMFSGSAHTKMVRRGHLMTLYKDPETGELRGIKYDIDDRTEVEERGLGAGVVLATQQLIKYVVHPVTVAFAIHDAFEREAARRHIPHPILERIEDAFSTKQPLDKLKPGSAIKLIYDEQVSRDGAHKQLGDVEAAQIATGGKTLSAFSFRDEHGRAHLYDDQGRPLGPQFLRFPLPFEYISSGFSESRFHPILHRYRAHVGVDLVAEYGTPVRAVSDGRVETAGWAGELGQCVRVAHEHDLTSIYGHLSKISHTVTAGSFVRIGEVIGWVGTTGLSTGPHLHFALYKRGEYVNPLTIKLESSHEIAPRIRLVFTRLKEQDQLALAKLPDLGTRSVDSSDRKPAISHFGDLYHVEVKGAAQPGSHSHRRFRRAHSASARANDPAGQTTASGDYSSGAL